MEPITRSNKPRNWTRKRINRELAARGLRQSDLVRQIGKSQSLVSEVVSGKLKSLPVALVIADALGSMPHEIWPRVYAPPSGEPSSEPTAEPDPAPIAKAC